MDHHMSRRHGPWQLLELDPTEDQREIRRAYATKLKAIDVERDPQAFITLREAFEQAQQIGRWIAYEREHPEEALDEDEDEDEEAEAPEMAELIGSLQVDLDQGRQPAPEASSAPEQREGPWSPPTPEKFDAHAAALARLLQRNNLQPRPWPTDAERAEMLEHWRVLIADPRAQQLDFHADLERWIAGLLGFTIPFCDTLIVPVTEYFGWVRDEGMISQSDGLAEVVYRYRMLSFLDDIRTPGNPHFEAWCELTTPADEHAARGRVSVRKIHKLLHEVRRAYPGIEGNFQPERVALWDRRGAGESALGPEVADEKQPTRIPGYLLWFFLLCIIVPAISSLNKNGNPSSRSPAMTKLLTDTIGLTDEEEDIKSVLKGVGDGSLTIEKIEKPNPQLAQLLRSNWQLGQEQGQTLFNFVKNVSEVVNNGAMRRRQIASPETLTIYNQLVVDKGRALRSISPVKCAGYFTGTSLKAADLPASLIERENALITRLILEPGADPAPRKGPTTFQIPPAVFQDALKRAKISPERMREAAMNRGTPADICATAIALTEAAIAMPAGAERTRLLRSM
jgi:hypothetical protein